MPSLPPYPLPSPTPSQARLEALYASSAAQRESNPTGYAANAAWWAAVLELGLVSGFVNGPGDDIAQAEGNEMGKEEEGGGESEQVVGGVDRLVFKLDERLGRRFEWGGRVPKGLAGVVETLATAQPPTLSPLPIYQTSPTPLLAPPSLVGRFVARPLWWAVSQLNPFGHSGPLLKEDDVARVYGRGKEWVHLGLIQEAAAKYKQYIASHPPTSFSDSVHDVASFQLEYGAVCLPTRATAVSKSGKMVKTGKRESLSRRDVELLIRWLMRDEGVVVSDGSVIRILEDGQAVGDHPITEVERGIVSVKNALRKVELQIESVEQQIERCQVKAKAHLSSNQRNLAMSQLRTKKALVEVLEKRAGVVEQLRSVIRGIDQASSDAEVMAAYEQSTSTLKTLLANPLLDRDRVDSTTEALAETLADQHEIDEAIQHGGEVAMGAAGRVDVDEDELEKELAEMVRDEKARADEAEAAREAEVREEARRAEKRREEKQEAKLAVLDSVPESAAATDVRTQEDHSAEDEWEKRYAESRAREIAEKERAELERVRKEEKEQGRVVAE